VQLPTSISLRSKPENREANSWDIGSRISRLQWSAKRDPEQSSSPQRSMCMHWNIVINNSWNGGAVVKMQPVNKDIAGETKVSIKNLLAAIVIVAIIVGGGAALYKMDDGRGARSSSDIAAKTASD